MADAAPDAPRVKRRRRRRKPAPAAAPAAAPPPPPPCAEDAESAARAKAELIRKLIEGMAREQAKACTPEDAAPCPRTDAAHVAEVARMRQAGRSAVGAMAAVVKDAEEQLEGGLRPPIPPSGGGGGGGGGAIEMMLDDIRASHATTMRIFDDMRALTPGEPGEPRSTKLLHGAESPLGDEVLPGSMGARGGGRVRRRGAGTSTARAEGAVHIPRDAPCAGAAEAGGGEWAAGAHTTDRALQHALQHALGITEAAARARLVGIKQRAGAAWDPRAVYTAFERALHSGARLTPDLVEVLRTTLFATWDTVAGGDHMLVELMTRIATASMPRTPPGDPTAEEAARAAAHVRYRVDLKKWRRAPLPGEPECARGARCYGNRKDFGGAFAFVLVAYRALEGNLCVICEREAANTFVCIQLASCPIGEMEVPDRVLGMPPIQNLVGPGEYAIENCLTFGPYIVALGGRDAYSPTIRVVRTPRNGTLDVPAYEELWPMPQNAAEPVGAPVVDMRTLDGALDAPAPRRGGPAAAEDDAMTYHGIAEEAAIAATQLAFFR